MNAVTAAAVLLPAAFVLGAIPFGYLAGRMRGVDLRAHGSGNIGATNVLRVLGTGPGLMVLALDILKGWLPIAACRSLLVSSGGEIVSSAGGWLLVGTGLAAILGHTFSPFLRFQGGKGVATSMGVLLGLSPLVAGLSCLAFVLVVALTRYVSLGSMLAAVTQATLFWLPLAGAGGGNNGARFPTAFGLFGLLVAAFVLAKHRSNIGRLLAGTENRFGHKPPHPPAPASEPAPRNPNIS